MSQLPNRTPRIGSIIVDEAGEKIDTEITGGKNRLLVRDEISSDRDGLVGVQFGKAGITATSWFLLVDVSSAGYKHVSGTKVKISAASGLALKTSSSGKWDVQLGVVTAIDGSQATIVFLASGTIYLRDTFKFISTLDRVSFFPLLPSLEVLGAGDLAGLATNLVAVTTDINTGTALERPISGTAVPSIGDVVLRSELLAGSGSLDFVYSLSYRVES